MRPGVDELTWTTGNSHMLMEGHMFLLLEIRRTTLSSRKFPQAPQGIETPMPDLGKRTSREQTLYYSFVVLYMVLFPS